MQTPQVELEEAVFPKAYNLHGVQVHYT